MTPEQFELLLEFMELCKKSHGFQFCEPEDFWRMEAIIKKMKEEVKSE